MLICTAAAVTVGIWTLYNQPVDAIPDLSDTQVIVYSRWDRSPDIIEDQVTYPIATALLGAPKVKAVGVTRTSASPTCTSSLKTAQTSIGPEAVS